MMQMQEQYVDSGFNSYAAAQNQMHQMSGWRMDDNSGHNFEGCLEAFTPERENSYVTSKAERQWQSTWDRSESKISHSITSHMFNEGCYHATRSYFQDHRPDQKQSGAQPLSKIWMSDLRINLLLQNLEDLEQKFLEDIVKLVKEQNDAEDVENARHRELVQSVLSMRNN